MLTSAFQREHCVSHRRFWLLLLQVPWRCLHHCHRGQTLKQSWSRIGPNSANWRWSVWWPSMEPGGLASGTSGRGLRTSRTILTQFFHMFPTFVYSYLTLRNGGIALAQAHIASLIIFVSQCVNLCIVYLTSTKYAKMSCSIIKKRPNCFP